MKQSKMKTKRNLEKINLQHKNLKNLQILKTHLMKLVNQPILVTTQAYYLSTASQVQLAQTSSKLSKTLTPILNFNTAKRTDKSLSV